jgi:fatty acid-binding protein DegV
VLHLEDGRIEPLARVRTKRKATEHLVGLITTQMQGKPNVHVAIMDAAAKEEAQQIGNRLQAELQPLELLFGEMSPVIGAHVGPGAIGVGFYAEP